MSILLALIIGVFFGVVVSLIIEVPRRVCVGLSVFGALSGLAAVTLLGLNVHFGMTVVSGLAGEICGAAAGAITAVLLLAASRIPTRTPD